MIPRGWAGALKSEEHRFSATKLKFMPEVYICTTCESSQVLTSKPHSERFEVIAFSPHELEIT